MIQWDMNEHPIADAHPGDLNAILFPGQDYNNGDFYYSIIDHD
jgi:phospholipase D1/2